MSSQGEGIERIRRLARHAERRLRLRRVLRAGANALCGALIVAVVIVALRKLGILGETPARMALVIAAAGVGMACAFAWLWRLPPRAGARSLDRFHGLHDRLASALAFAEEEVPASRTAFMDAAIDDALLAAHEARPGLAVPIRPPRALAGVLGLVGVLLGVLLFEVRHHVAIVHAKTIDAAEMAPDDLDDVRDFLTKLQQKDQSGDTKAAIEEFNKLVDDIASRRLDRTEAFRHIEKLEERLLTDSEAAKKALVSQLQKLGEELEKADLTKPVGEALADNKLDQARDALQELAKKMRDPNAKIDKAKLDQMREALKKAAAEADKRQQELERHRQELADDILKKKEKLADGGGSEEERSLLEKKERELERLDRAIDEQRGAGRQLDRLDRELEQAAEDLMKELGASAQDLDQGAEDLNRMQQEQMTQEEKEELRQKLQEMRQRLREGGQGGKGQVMRLKRFGRMARGQAGPQGQGEQEGTGQGQEGQQGEGNEGQNGEGQQGGQGQGSTQGQSGETWVLGPNGEKMLMLSRGSGAGGEGNGGKGQGAPGRGWGDGHDPNLQGRATNPKMGTQDTQVEAADTGQGGSRSQVILGASERGFASRGYKKVYTEYHQVAEESLSKDEVPGGYRSYVKRYFQLIRPREER